MSENHSIFSSESELRNFIASSVWNDMRTDMLLWLEDVREQLETQPKKSILNKLQGNAEAIHRFLDLPAVLLEILEVQSSSRR